MTGIGAWHESPATLDRVQTARGELVLRATSDRFEIISNGVFLMDTSDGTSERLLVDAAVRRCTAPAPRLLIGGLGVGFSLVQATAYAHLAGIDVVEIEPAVIGWHERFLGHRTGDALRDRRVRIIEADVLAWLDRTADRYDIICLDTDNGPNWLVHDGNAEVYAERGLDLACRRLLPGGLLAVWGANRDEDFERRLRQRFGGVEILETPRPRGVPDVVYLVRAG